ncbi:BA14K family protein [Oryzifoliimicrobium ureilyticus]|uniref:BA14K family protein n=1 Tax=Oryzifoliimicrobium ureilyticus TaxID=3113724 RepID=UPI0030763595
MKALASLIFSVVSVIGACIAGSAIATIFMASPASSNAPQPSAADLWTSAPVRVDPAQQKFERVSPLLSSYAQNEPPVVDKLDTEVAVSNAAPEAAQNELSPDHVSWCMDRYRSYDQATDSYRTYSGEMRGCHSPYDRQSVGSNSDTTAAVTPQAAAWCAQRYQSYRSEDNTYQPFSGPRRQCEASDGDLAQASN